MNPISITTTADEDPEPDESFILTYSADYATVPVKPTAIGTINNDDGQVLTITSAEVNENVGTVDLKITLSPAPSSGETVAVSYQTVDGTAIGSIDGSNADYTTIVATTVQFGEDEKSKPIQINIEDDTFYEVQEAFTVVVSTTTSDITTHANGVGTVTINDDDSTPPALDFVALSGNIVEGTDANTNTIHNITVNLGTGVIAGREITADYTLFSENAHIPHDIKLATTAPGRTSDTTGVITFAQGVGSVNIPLEIIADEFDEVNETFKISLANAVNATIGTESITGTIGDDDDSPNISISVAPVTEGNDPTTNGEMEFTVSLDKQSYKDIRVSYRTTTTGTATPDVDFSSILIDSEGEFPTLTFTKRSISSSGVVTEGMTSQSFTIPIYSDTLDENNETVYVLLSNPQNATLPPNEVVEIGTITDDDALPELTVSPAGGLEGTANAGEINFEWTLEPVSGREIILYYSTESGTAISGSDFNAVTKTLLKIPAGDTSGTISVTTMEDSENETDETFTLKLSDELNVTLVATSIQGTIENDDLLISLEKEHYPIGALDATFYLAANINLDSDLDVTYEINYMQADGDFVFRQWNVITVTIPAGSTYLMIQHPANYRLPSSDQNLGSLNVRLVDGANYGLGLSVDADLSLVAVQTTPLVSISRIGSERLYETKVNLSQQKLARFQIIAQPKPTSEKTLTIWVTQEGDFIAEQYTPGRWLEKSVVVDTETGNGILEIAIEDDELDEPNGLITATIQEGSDYHVGNFTNRASVEVIDDDGDDTMPEIAITAITVDNIAIGNDLTATEGSTIKIEFGSNISVRGTNPLIINYEITIAGEFFNPIPVGVLTTEIAPGASNSVIQFSTTDDELEEANGSLVVTLLSGSGYFLASSKSRDNTKEIIIADDDPTLFISSLSKIEGNSGSNIMNFEVMISSAPSEEVTVAFATSNGSARQGIDFTATSGTLVFPANSTTPQPIPVTINPDTIDEDNEEFELVLSNPTGGAKIGSSGIAIGTIEDDDEAPLLSINSVEIEEGQTGEKDFTFTASLDRVSSRNVTFEYSTTGITATAGEDFISVKNKEATIVAGSTSLPINVKVKGDTIDESDEIFTIALAIAVNATIPENGGIGKGTIISDDNPAFHVVNKSGLEDPDGEIIFEVTLSPVLNVPASVRFTTVSGATDTAVSGVDFVAVDQILEFGTGEQSKFVTVELKSDDLDEDDEEFTVRLTSQSGGANIVGNGIAKGLIIDNDGEINMSISDAEIIEGNTGEVVMEFTVSLDSPSGRDVSVRYNTADLTSEDVADDETDYIPVIDGVLIFIPGITEKILSISIKGDDEFEPDEAYYLVLSEATNATITRNIGVGTILNDDPEIPRLNLDLGQKTVYNEGEVVEIGISTLLFHSAESEIELPINISQNGDFIRWRNSNVITIDSDQEMIRIPTHDDEVPEQSGSITVSIEKAEGEYTVNPVRSSVTVSVLDNDGIDSTPQPKIGVASQVANRLLDLFAIPNETPQEGETSSSLKPILSVVSVAPIIAEGASAEFDIVSRGIIHQTFAVQFQIKQIGDFIGGRVPSQINLTQSHSSARLAIETVDDSLAEEDGQITLILIESTYYRIGEQSNATVFISDEADRLERKEAISVAGEDVLSDLVGSIGARSINTATSRVRSALNATGPTTQFELNGADRITDFLTAGGEMINGNSMSMQSVLGNSSFSIDLFPENNSSSPATIWGLGDYRDLKSSRIDSSNSWNGDVFTGQFGFDAKVGSSILTGLSVSVIESNIQHNGVIEDGLMFRSSSNTLNSYFGWSSEDRGTYFSGIAGYGLGEIAIEQNNYETELLNSQFYTVGFGGEHQLYTSESILGGITEVEIAGESWLTNQFVNGIADKIRDIEIMGSHYQISVIGSHQTDLASGTFVKPTASIGLRRDQKNHDSIVGIELGSGLSLSNLFGFAFTGNANTLMLEYDEIQKWSLIGNLTYDFDGDQLGTLFEVSPSIGQMVGSRSSALWSSEILDNESEQGQYKEGLAIDTEFGYGIGIYDGAGILTPFGGMDYTENEVTSYKIGTRVLFGSGLKLEFESSQQISADSDTKHDFQLKGGISW